MILVVLLLGLAAALAGLGFGFGFGERAGAAVVGCAPTAAGRAFDTEGIVTVTAEWSLGPHSGSQTIEHPFPAALADTDGDGDVDLDDYDGGDGVFDFDGDGIFDTRIADHIDFDQDGTRDIHLWADLNTLTSSVSGGFQYNAIAKMMQRNYGYEVLADGYGLDYADSLVTSSAPPFNFLPLAIDVYLVDGTPGHTLPAGTISLSYTLPFTDGTSDTYTATLDTTTADITGAELASSPWPFLTQTSIFLDGVLFDTVVVGLGSSNVFGAPTPVSDLSLEVVIDNVAGEDRDNRIKVAARGAFTQDGSQTTGMGMPGRLGGAIVKECDTLPNRSWVGIGHDAGELGTVMPESLDLGLSIYSGDTNSDGILNPDTERTLYVDATIDDPPSLMHVLLGQDDVDVDGDGNTDGLDINRDGEVDVLPLEYVGFEHDGSTSPDLEAVVATRPKDGAPSGAPLYLAARVEDVPPAVAFERAGTPTGIDADGDLAYDDLNGDLVVDADDAIRNDRIGSLAFCEKDFATSPAPCLTPTVSPAMTDVTYLEDIPTPDLTTGALPFEAGAPFPLPADDLVQTQSDHFELNPPSWITADAETTIATDPNGVDTKTINLTSASAHIAGVEQIDWNLRSAGDLKVNAQTAGLRALGAQVHVLDTTTGADTTVWSVVADAPDFVAVSVDAEPESIDEDPVAVTWDTGAGRIGAAVAVDAHLPENDDREVVASAWFGKGIGALNGLAANATVEIDLEGDDQGLELTSPSLGSSRTLVDAGFATRTAAQAAAGFATRGHVTMGIPDDMEIDWSVDNHTLEQATLGTCTNSPFACAVEDLAATIVNAEYTGDLVHDALLGVDMVPVPDADGAEFPDFTAYPEIGPYAPDWAHVVWHDDPLAESEYHEPPVLDARDTWGLDVHLARVSTAQIDRWTTETAFVDTFNHTGVCLDGTTQENVLGLGIYADEGPGEPASWFDGAVTRTDSQLYMTFDLNTPDPDGGGVIGDLSLLQQAALVSDPDDHDLFDIAPDGCAIATDGGTTTLNGRFRRGDEASVRQVLDLGAQSRAAGSTGIPVPGSHGIDAAFYTAEIDDTNYQGLDAAVQIDLPGELLVRQPEFRRCSVGNRPPLLCSLFADYDATERSDVKLEIESVSQGFELGDVDVEYLGEPIDAGSTDADDCVPERLDDECALRAALHVESLRSNLTVDGTLLRRARDGYLDADITIANEMGQALEAVSFEYRDDYDPARLGVPVYENGATDQPIAQLVLDDVAETLTIETEMWAPTYGVAGLAYDKNDCGPWTDPAQDDHIYPKGDDPTTWRTEGPRDPDTVRPPYLHGTLDLDPDEDGTSATTIRVEADARVDEPGDYSHGKGDAIENWYDDDPRRAIKVGLDTADVLTNGELWAAYPGLTEYELQLNKTDRKTRLETCMDIDVPMHFTWSDASNFRLGIDSVNATLSLPEAEVKAGADATIAIEERLAAPLEGSPVVTGIWVQELKTWFQPPTKDWYSGVSTERMPLGFLDPLDLHLETVQHDILDVQDDLYPSGEWMTSGDESGRWYAEVFLQPLFHPDIEGALAEETKSGDAVDAWNGKEGLWPSMNEKTDRITTWTLPALSTLPAIVSDTEDGFLDQTTHNCVDLEKNANSSEFVPAGETSDGTTFKFLTRWDNERVEIFLVGYYDNGQVRFVRELYDNDPGQKTCMLRLQGEIAIAAATGRIEVHLDVDGTSASSPAAKDWSSVIDDSFVFDPSGNGWKKGDFPLDDVDGVVGQPVRFNGGESPFALRNCIWLPGDGTRLTEAHAENGGATATHTYAFPGTYQVMQLCSEDSYPSEEDQFQADLREGTVRITVVE